MSIITIVGAGMMGSAMSIPASDNGHEVRIVGTPLDRDIIESARKNGYHITLKRQLPDGIKYYQIEELDEALLNCDLLIGGISSFGIEWFGDFVLPKIPKSLPVLLVTKGLHAMEDGTLIPFPDYLATKQGCDNLSINAVGGPCTSYELADRNNTVVAYCGHDINILLKIKEMLSTEYYHINISTDVIGIETAVAMKNAYALGVTLAVGLKEKEHGIGCKEDYNPQAGLFAQGTREMYRLLKLVGGKEESILYGVGDLYVTIFGGRTRKIGTLLGRGLTYTQALKELSGITLESVAITNVAFNALMKLSERGKADINHFPLLSHIYDLINDKTTVNIPWHLFEENGTLK